MCKSCTNKKQKTSKPSKSSGVKGGGGKDDRSHLIRSDDEDEAHRHQFLDDIDYKKDLVEKQLESLGFEVTKTFAVPFDYDPISYLNERYPQDRAEHDHFMRKFKDGVYSIATPSKHTQHALLQVLFNENERVLLEIHRPIKVLIGFANTDHDETRSRKDKKKANKKEKSSSASKSDKKSKENKRSESGKRATSASSTHRPGSPNAETSNLIVYVPNCYLTPLINAQLERIDMAKKKSEYLHAMSEHDRFYREFTEKYLDNLFLNSNINLRDVALNGNLLEQNVPPRVIESIQLDKLNVTGEPNYFPLGEFEAHRQRIKLPNGQEKFLVLKVITKLNDTKTRQYRDRNINVTEIKEFYSIIYDLTLE